MSQPTSPAPDPPPTFTNPAELRPFQYEAQTVDGLLLHGTMTAPSAAEVQSRLAAMQLRVLSVEPAMVKGRSWRMPIGTDDFLVFNQQLAHLAAAGLPVERGLRLIAADLRTGRLSTAAAAVAAELEKGVPMAEAFAHHASRFPSLYGKLVDAGIQTNNLPAMLFSLGHHLELVAKLRQSLWCALSYPFAVLTFMSLILLLISIKVLPEFRGIYGSFNTAIPQFTRTTLAVGEMYPYVFAGVWLLVAAFIVVVILLKATGRGGMVADTLLIGIPVIGPALRASLLARWIDALRLGIDAGLDLPRALSLASEATASPRLAESARLADIVSSGSPIELLPRHGLIPTTVPAAIELGSKAGDLQSTLATLSRMYQQQAEHRVKIIPAIINPICLLLMGSTVMVAIAALFFPLFNIIKSLSTDDW